MPTNNNVRRPVAPEGYMRFKWKTRKKDDFTEQLCPNCGQTGSCWQGGGWQDPVAQKEWEKVEECPTGSFDALCHPVDKVMLKCHWSRWGEGYCLKCGVKFWHDFGGNDMVVGETDKIGFGNMGDEWYYYWQRPKVEELEKQKIFNKQLSLV